MNYSSKEKAFIYQEVKALIDARGQKIETETLRQWLKDFSDLGYTAEQVCRILRLARYKNIKQKIMFADLLSFADDIGEVTQIIPVQTLKPKNTEMEAEESSDESIQRRAEQIQDAHSIGLNYAIFLFVAGETGYDIADPNERRELVNILKNIPRIKSLTPEQIVEVVKKV